MRSGLWDPARQVDRSTFTPFCQVLRTTAGWTTPLPDERDDPRGPGARAVGTVGAPALASRHGPRLPGDDRLRRTARARRLVGRGARLGASSPATRRSSAGWSRRGTRRRRTPRGTAARWSGRRARRSGTRRRRRPAGAVPAGAGGQDGQEPACTWTCGWARRTAEAEVARLTGLGATVLLARRAGPVRAGSPRRPGGQRVLRHLSGPLQAAELEAGRQRSSLDAQARPCGRRRRARPAAGAVAPRPALGPKYRASSTSCKAASTLACTSRAAESAGSAPASDVVIGSSPFPRGAAARERPVCEPWCPRIGSPNPLRDQLVPMCHM